MQLPIVDPGPELEPGFRTPFDRTVEWTRTLLGRDARGDASLAHGARQVHVGLGLCAASMIAASTLLGVSAGWTAGVGALAAQALLLSGVLASSRWVRAVALLGGASVGWHAVTSVREIARTLADGGEPTLHATVSLLAALGYACGIAIATLAPAARAWHRARLVARAGRKATSLADWRAADMEERTRVGG